MASRPGSHCFEPTLSSPVGLIEPWLTKRIQSLPLMSPMLFLPAHTTAYSGLLPGAAETPAALYRAMARFRASSVPGMRFWVTAGTSLTLLMASTCAREISKARATGSGPGLPLEAPWKAPRSDSAPAMTTAVRARPRPNLLTDPPMVRTLRAATREGAGPGRGDDGWWGVGAEPPNSDLVDHIIGECREPCQQRPNRPDRPNRPPRGRPGGGAPRSPRPPRPPWWSWRCRWRWRSAAAVTAAARSPATVPPRHRRRPARRRPWPAP